MEVSYCLNAIDVERGLTMIDHKIAFFVAKPSLLRKELNRAQPVMLVILVMNAFFVEIRFVMMVLPLTNITLKSKRKCDAKKIKVNNSIFIVISFTLLDYRYINTENFYSKKPLELRKADFYKIKKGGRLSG